MLGLISYVEMSLFLMLKRRDRKFSVAWWPIALLSIKEIISNDDLDMISSVLKTSLLMSLSPGLEASHLLLLLCSLPHCFSHSTLTKCSEIAGFCFAVLRVANVLSGSLWSWCSLIRQKIALLTKSSNLYDWNWLHQFSNVTLWLSHQWRIIC